MGLLDIFTHTPRTFNVVVGDSWPINGEATQHESAEDVLAEIYDIAAYFPITTVEGPEQIFQIEMNEHGVTYLLEPPSKAVGTRGWQ